MLKKTIFILLVLFSSSSQALDAFVANNSAMCFGDGDHEIGTLTTGVGTVGTAGLISMLLVAQCCLHKQAFLLQRTRKRDSNDAFKEKLKYFQRITPVKVCGRRVALRIM